MSFKTRIIAISVAALLAVAGGIYAFMPDNRESAAEVGETAVPVQPVATADVTNKVSAPDKQVGGEAVVMSPDMIAAPKSPVKEQPANPPSTKLTRQQLTPPPATEKEKLEKAAQDESNF